MQLEHMGKAKSPELFVAPTQIARLAWDGPSWQTQLPGDAGLPGYRTASQPGSQLRSPNSPTRACLESILTCGLPLHTWP